MSYEGGGEKITGGRLKGKERRQGRHTFQHISQFGRSRCGNARASCDRNGSEDRKSYPTCASRSLRSSSVSQSAPARLRLWGKRGGGFCCCFCCISLLSNSHGYDPYNTQNCPIHDHVVGNGEDSFTSMTLSRASRARGSCFSYPLCCGRVCFFLSLFLDSLYNSGADGFVLILLRVVLPFVCMCVPDVREGANIPLPSVGNTCLRRRMAHSGALALHEHERCVQPTKLHTVRELVCGRAAILPFRRGRFGHRGTDHGNGVVGCEMHDDFLLEAFLPYL